MPRIANNQVWVGDFAASELAHRHGTPLYVYDAADIDARYALLSASIDHRPLGIYYSVKANATLGIVQRVRSLGARLDVCSPGDVAVAEAAGCAVSDLSYTGCGLSQAEFERVATAGIPFVADSLDQVERFGALAPGRDLGLRLNCGIDAGFHPHVRAGARDSKFGIHAEQLGAALRVARAASLRVVGLHAHVGSDVLDAAVHVRVAQALVAAADEVPDLEWINLGGGMGVPFAEHDREYDLAELNARVGPLLERLARERGRPIELRLEPGAYLLMDAGLLLTRVTELKPPIALDGGASPHFALTDTSHNHVVSAVIYGTEHPIVAVDAAEEQPSTTYTIAGNLMQAGDIVGRARRLPKLGPGDLLAIGRTGAYTACRAPTFNERPRPAEVLVDGAHETVIRRRETERDLLGGQELDPAANRTVRTVPA